MILSSCCNARVEYRKAILDKQSIYNGDVPGYAPYCPTCGEFCTPISNEEIFNNKI